VARAGGAIDPGGLTSFRGTAYCHVPADEPVRLERLVTTDGEDDRWNRPGEPSLYLATDPAIALAELARHLEIEREGEWIGRLILGLQVELTDLVDLRRPATRAALGCEGDVAVLRDRENARALASTARADPHVRGLLVPSVAFLDDPARANLVVFVDRLEAGVRDLVRGVREVGRVDLEAAAGTIEREP